MTIIYGKYMAQYNKKKLLFFSIAICALGSYLFPFVDLLDEKALILGLAILSRVF